MNKTSISTFIFLAIFLIALTSVSAETYIGSLPAGTNVIINQPSYVNLYAAVAGTDAASGIVDVTAGTSLAGFSAGDTILLIQTQWGNTGTYEMQEIASVAGSRIRTTTPMLNTYSTGAQAVRVPVFGNITVNSIITTPVWNGATGGIVAFRARDTAIISASGMVSVTALGGRGSAGSGTCSGLCKKGNVGAAAPGESFDGLAVGGTGSSCAGLEGQGGSNFQPANLNVVSLGAGGGGGQCFSAGGNGGGDIIIEAQTVTANGYMTADGSAGQSGTWSVGNAYAAGGGSGGSIIITTDTMNLGAGTVHALGGSGGYDANDGIFAGAGTNGKVRLDFGTLNGDTNPPAFRNRRPIANAGNDQTINANTQTTLDGSGSYDPDGAIVRYRWNFGDGTAVSTTTPTVTRSFPFGTFTVTLTVTDNLGATNSDTARIIADTQPTAVPGGPYNGTVNTSLTLDGSRSTDNGQIVTYTWDFGDGMAAATANPTINHVYTRVGTFTVTLTVRDNNGLTNSASTTATINPLPPNQPPVANAGSDMTVNANTNVILNGSGSYDPDGIIVLYTWNFGDGTTGSSSAPTIVHAFPLGTFTVTLTVTDNRGATNSDTARIIADTQPTAVPGGPYTGIVNVSLTLDGSRSRDNGQIVTYTWDFGDGTTAATANPIIDHVYTRVGTFTVTLTVRDNNGLTNSASTTATINTQPPIVVEQVKCVFENSNAVQQCYNDDDRFMCSGSGTCIADVSGEQGEKLTWKSSCGGYAYTVIDGNNEEAKFVCSGQLPPIADAGNDMTVNANTDVFLDGSGSFDPDGTIVLYTWDFGDGNVTSTTDAFITHEFPLGIFIVELTVTDNDGEMSSDFAIIIADGRPTAVPGGPYNGIVNKAIFLDGSGSTDNGFIVSYRWDFGDGNSTTSANQAIRHTYTQEGNFRVTLTVTDNDGISHSAATTATITRDNAVAERKTDEITILRVDMVDDEVVAGEDLQSSITVENDGDISFEDVHMTLSIPELGVQAHSSLFDLRKNDRVTKSVLLFIPEDAQGEYDVRVVISNDEFKRVTYRTIWVR